MPQHAMSSLPVAAFAAALSILACLVLNSSASPAGMIPAFRLFAWLRPLRGGAIQPWEATKIPPDYYTVLGIPKTASEGEIRKAHKVMALKHHPDKNKGSAASNDKFVLIQVSTSLLHRVTSFSIPLAHARHAA